MRIENSFIPVRGVGEQTERRLWRHGITEWDAFDGSVVGTRRARRVFEFIDLARDHLDRDDTGFFYETFPAKCHWRLYENFRNGTCFLDIETTGLSRHHDEVTVVSLHQNDATTTLIRGHDLTRANLASALDEARLLVTFNGKRFDIPFLEHTFDLDLDIPHLDLMYPCKRLGMTGGLKRIERTLGINRTHPDVSGLDAVRLWYEYERGHDQALDTLVTYNQDDTINLRHLTETIVHELHQEVFESTVNAR